MAFPAGSSDVGYEYLPQLCHRHHWCTTVHGLRIGWTLLSWWFALAEWNGDLRPHPYASIWNVARTHGHPDCVGSDGATWHHSNRSRAGCFPADVASPWHPHPCARDNLWIPRRHCCIDGFALVFCLHVGF